MLMSVSMSRFPSGPFKISTLSILCIMNYTVKIALSRLKKFVNNHGILFDY